MDYGQRAKRFADSVRQAPARLAKPSSNLFRDPARAGRGLDAGALDHVLAIDADNGWVDAEAMTPYDALLEATLEAGVMPCVVPQLKSITIGGAVSGIGIESSSFRHGLVHETVRELDVALPDGELVTATPDNDLADLFYGFPNSYGTLGYATRVRAKTLAVKPFVDLEHRVFSSDAEFFAAMAQCVDGDSDFIDGVVFDPGRLVLTTARFAAETDGTSDYTDRNIYYRSVEKGGSDSLTTRDYIWRWDTDWFWCSKNLGAQNPLVRRLLGKRRLNSRFYTRVMRWNSRWRIMQRLERLGGRRRESVIQDMDVPIRHAADFLDFFRREIGITPVWTCPVRRPRGCRGTFPLFPMAADTTYVNFGFWDVLRFREDHPPGHFNRRIESVVEEFGGLKSLYSTSYYSREKFDALYGGEAYRGLKEKYDPGHRFPGLYEKCVLGR